MGKIFSKHTIAATGFFLFVLLLSGMAEAVHEEADLFEKAYGYYLSYQPEKAIEAFDQFIDRFPSSSAMDSVMFWRAKSLVQMKRIDEAARDFSLMKERYPDSSYTVFAEKELDAIQQSSRKAEKQDVSKERDPKQGEARSSVYEEKIGRLESEISGLEKKLGDSEKLRQLTEKGLVKALDDKNGLEAQVEEARRIREDLGRKLTSAEKSEKEYARLIEDRKALEAKLKDQEDKLKAVSTQAEHQKDRDKELAALTARLQEQEKKQKEFEATIKQLTQERQQQEERIRLNEQSRQQAVQELNEKLKKAETDRAALEEQLGREKKRLAEASGKGSERETSLQNEVNRLEKERKDLLAKADTLKGERDTAAKQVAEVSRTAQERKQAEADAQRLRSETEALQKKVKELESAQQDRKALEAKLKDQEDKLKAVSTQAEHQKDRDKELAALTAKNYERPLVRIAGESYSVGRFVNESAAADNVKRKLKKGPAPWDRKNPLDTFILEEVLFHMAQKENMTAKGSDVDTLSREHGLSREEAQYLMKYLAVDNMYQRKAAEVALPSVDAKTYYEKNRDEFVSRPAGKSVRIMAIPYTANDELEKGILALEFLQEASKGKSLEDIARKNRSNASLREVPVDSLKGWLREKVDLLRDGELSPVISSGNEYVIMQTQKVKIQYRPYEEVRNEILKKLTPDNNEQKRLIEHWLGKIYDQAEFIR